MLQIKDIYSLPARKLSLSDYVLREDWFPELSCTSPYLDTAVVDAMEAEGRLQVRELINDNIGDGYRMAQMSTVWFDGEPVFIVQNAGRSGRDHFKRWVTNSEKYVALVAYLLSKAMAQQVSSDLVSPEEWVYEEEVFQFYGRDFAQDFGYQTEPKAAGYCFLGEASLVPGYEPSWALVMLSKDVHQAHPYIRRGDYVMQLRRELSQEELDSNPLLTSSLEGTEYNRYVWYAPATRPDNESVLSI